MMLFKLSLKNIRRSIKDYAIYFFTLVLGVAIFYVFNAIDSQTVMLNVSSSTYDVIKLMTRTLSGISVFVSLVLGFLIIYASRFLIKRRNKEFGIYLTLGMSKKKISLILFFETLLIGIISLAVGIVIGTLLSQLMSLLVANMFDADMTQFKFIFSKSACFKTLIYFGIMYLFVMIFNTIMVNKCKLINLLYYDKKTESIKLKNPIACIVVFIIGVIMLAYSYYKVTIGVNGFLSSPPYTVFIIIGLGCVSTFLIFWSMSGFILNIVMAAKKTYYKGLNSFTLRQVSSSINTTVFSITIICLMLFTTICLLSSCFSLKESMAANLNELAPVDVELSKMVDTSSYNSSSKVISIDTTLNKYNFDINSNFKDITEVNTYTGSLTFKDTLGKSLKYLEKKYGFLRYDSKEEIMTISDYNRIAKLYGKKTYKLGNNEYIIIANYKQMIEIRNLALENKNTITLNGEILAPKYDECKDGFINMGDNQDNIGIVIIPDRLASNLTIEKEILAANYKAKSDNKKHEIETKINKVVKGNLNKITPLTLNTKIDIEEASIGLGAMVTFIGLYLGIIFLISSAAILALKELSESTDNAERFTMLRRLGADEKMINKALFSQIFIFFMFPLLLAILHSIFGIKFATYILSTVGTKGLLPAIMMTSAFLLVIYGGYFIITYVCSKNIIKER